MPAGPAPADVVLRRQAQELLPQVPVPDGLTAGGFPAVFLPVVEPAVGEGFFQVLTVRRDRHAARLPQGLERPDGGREFHAVVRRAGLMSTHLTGVAAARQQEGPAAFPSCRFT